MSKIMNIAAILLLATPAIAADRQYSGMQTREIKALSSEQIGGYLRGEGMGFAMAAELNGWPGPKHILELADELGLSDGQRERIESLFREMKSEATTLGARLVEAERALDSLLANGEASEAAVKAAIAAAGEIESELRFAHIRAHLRSKNVLTAEQRDRYSEARGYREGHAQHSHHH